MTKSNNPKDSLAPTDIDPELQKLPQNLRALWMKSPSYQATLRRRAQEAAEAARPDKPEQSDKPVRPDKPAETASREADEKPEKPDAETELREWEQERLAQADELGMVPLERGFPSEGFWRLPRMREPGQSAPQRYDGPPAQPDDAETELTALIGETRYFMREIVFHSARLACDPTDRIRFIDAGCSLVKAGSEVGKTVALLRSGGVAPVAERRQTITVEHVERKLAPPTMEEGEG